MTGRACAPEACSREGSEAHGVWGLGKVSLPGKAGYHQPRGAIYGDAPSHGVDFLVERSGVGVVRGHGRGEPEASGRGARRDDLDWVRDAAPWGIPGG